MPAKMAARRTETKVKKAERVASLESVLNVLGSEQTKEMTAKMAAKPTVHTLWLVIVLRYLAPVKTWRPFLESVCSIEGKFQMRYLNECVVQQEHCRRHVPDPTPAVE